MKIRCGRFATILRPIRVSDRRGVQNLIFRKSWQPTYLAKKSTLWSSNQHEMYLGPRGNPSVTIYKRSLSFGVNFLQQSENFKAKYQIWSKIREFNIQACEFKTLDGHQIHIFEFYALFFRIDFQCIYISRVV